MAHSSATKGFLGLVAFSLAGSLAARLMGSKPPWVGEISGVLVLLLGCAGAFGGYVHRGGGIRLGAIFLLGIGAELIGLATGHPFGRYSYTHAWWPSFDIPRIGTFPLLLPFAWALVAGSSALICRRISLRWLRPLAGAALATLVDFVMEPTMTGPIHYWTWNPPGPLPGGAPVENPIGWFVISFVAATILSKGNDTEPDPAWVLAGYVLLVMGLGAVGLR